MIQATIITAEDAAFWQRSQSSTLRLIIALYEMAILRKPVPPPQSIANRVSLKMLQLSDIHRPSLRWHIAGFVAGDVIAVGLNRSQILDIAMEDFHFGYDIQGLTCAAHSYFGKTVSELQLEEIAFLAAIIKSPSRYDAIKHPAETLQRRNDIIDNMQRAGFITGAQATAARASPLAVLPTVAFPPP